MSYNVKRNQNRTPVRAKKQCQSHRDEETRTLKIRKDSHKENSTIKRRQKKMTNFLKWTRGPSHILDRKKKKSKQIALYLRMNNFSSQNEFQKNEIIISLLNRFVVMETT